MTCEVAVMNARGIALAADSAVTLGDGPKVYFTAEKLFELTPLVPVGIMTYGRADLASVPWETIVAGYQKHLGNHRYDTLAEYLSEFVTFVEGATKLFPDDDLRDDFVNTAGRIWAEVYGSRW